MGTKSVPKYERVKHRILIKIVNTTNNSVPYPVVLCIVMNGVDISIISCGCVTDLGGVSRTHVIDSTTIVFKKNHVPWKSGCV
jgi:hypothetical protein